VINNHTIRMHVHIVSKKCIRGAEAVVALAGVRR